MGKLKIKNFLLNLHTMDYVMLENKEGKKLTKKLFLGLGGLAVAAVPVMSVIGIVIQEIKLILTMSKIAGKV